MITVLDLDKHEDQIEYKKLIENFHSKRPYDSLEFIKSFSDGYKDLFCVKCKIDEDIVMLPGYMRTIDNTEYLDFVSPYGYSGLIYNYLLPAPILQKAWNEIYDFLSKNFISTFIRFSLNTNYSIFGKGIVPQMKNIKGKILDYETQWSYFNKKVRKNVKRAKKESLVAAVYHGSAFSDEKLTTFYNIYVDTMERKKASEKFYFLKSDFGSFIKSNEDLCAFCFIYDSHKVVSVEMVLINDDSIFSFLGGTLAEAFSKRPNDLLKYELINWSRKNNFKYFVLGGGYGKDDGIYKYKQAFFPNDVIDYCTGQFIHNQDLYEKLTERSMEKYISYGNTIAAFKALNFFPLYRAG